MSIVNQTVPRALKSLGYTKKQIDAIVDYIDVEKTILGAPALKKEHENVFACSMGDNAIHYLGHVKMMGAVQPFISGAISKTVNMPEEATIEDVEKLHIDSWRLGLKAVAIYRDNCKVAQPLSMAKKEGSEEEKKETVDDINDKILVRGAVRRSLPRVRNSKTYSFTVAGLHGYFTVGEFEDGTPGELFISIAKVGSTLAGLMDSFGRSISYGLQYGVPLKTYVNGMAHMAFAPAGITDDGEIKTASSVIDYIFRRLAMDYLSFDDRLELGLADLDDMPELQTTLLAEEETEKEDIVTTELTEEEVREETNQIAFADVTPKVTTKSTKTESTAPMCYNCGNQTQRSGSCYVCTSCGSTTGCS
jgi:ribonucleoside-diphosphate reductase alpha chain